MCPGVWTIFDARDVVAEEMPADVVLVRVRDEHAGQTHIVGLDLLDDGVDLPRRVDSHALPGLGVADQVDEVLHGAQLHLPQVHGLG